MRTSTLSLATIALANLFPTLQTTAQAADTAFTLTYHIERIAADRLNIETCGSVVSDLAGEADLSAVLQSFPGQLVTVQGGRGGSGAFVVQCIAVDATTVAVVQGFDYSNAKGPLGETADRMIAALKAKAE